MLPTLKFLFRIAYKHADADIQRDVALNFVKILKEEDSEVVTVYGETFWSMDQMEHLCADDIQMLKRHFFSRVSSENDNVEIIRTLQGIGKYLSSKDSLVLFNLLIRIRLFQDSNIATAASRVLQNEYRGMNEDTQSEWLKRLDQFQIRFRETERNDLVTILAKEKDLLEIPFQ